MSILSGGGRLLPVASGSNWNAAANPIIYQFQRTDVSWDQINNNGGFAQVQINGVNLTAYFEVDDNVYLHSLTEVYNDQAIITASAFSGGNTLITLDLVYVSNDGSYALLDLDKRTDDKLYIEVFRSSDDESLTGGTLLQFSHAHTGIFRVDVSAVVRSFVSAEWIEPSAANEVDSEASIDFYITYQEFYDGVLQGSPTDDSSNPIHAVFAAMQIGSANGGNMLAYFIASSTKKFLQKIQPSTTFEKMVMWRDWPFTLSFIWPDAGFVTAIKRRTRQFDEGGGTISTAYDSLTAHTADINRLAMPTIDATAKRIEVRLQLGTGEDAAFSNDPSISGFSGAWTDIVNAGVVWDFTTPGQAKATLGAGGFTNYARSDAFGVGSIPSGAAISIAINHNTSAFGYNVLVFAWNGTTRAALTTIAVPAASGTASGTATAPFDFNKVEVAAVETSGGVNVVLTQINLSWKAIYLTETLDIEIRDECSYNADFVGVIAEKNPVHLFWKNSVGGDSFWHFDKYHEYNYTYQNGRKAKRVTLFAMHLHPVQWEALNELNGTGEVYTVPVTELTSSINKTSAQIGQQVYMLSKDGSTKTGVIVIPSDDKQVARDITHTIAITIELPEIFSLA